MRKINHLTDRQLLIWLAIAAILINIKSVFTDFDIDAEYALVMAHRMANGDKMFLQMWEPHQTSAFLGAFFIKIYQSIFGTSTGIMLYLHGVGFVLKASVTYMLYRSLMKFLVREKVLLICIFFFAVSPKGILMPEFSNMQLWFAMGLFCSILIFFRNQEKIQWLMLASVFMCLQILAYPSCIIVFLGILICLYVYSEKKRKVCLIFGCSSLLIGVVYLGNLVASIGADFLVENLKYIIQGDSSHAETVRQKYVRYLEESVDIIIIFCVIAGVALFVSGIWYIKKYFSGAKKCKSEVVAFGDTCFWVCLLLYIVQSVIIKNERFEYLILYPALIIKAIFYARRCEREERKIFVLGTVLGILNMVSVLVLSNMPLMASFGYLIPAVAVSFIPVLHNNKELENDYSAKIQWKLVPCVIMCLIVRYGMVILTPSNTELLFHIGGIVKSGPAMGFVTEYMRAYIINESMQEWENYIETGDSILIVAENQVSTLGYMYEDTLIGVDSTICTPTYSDKLLEYWETNPEKYPDVVVVDCWYGDLNVDEESWIMKWIDEEFSGGDYRDGKFWRYYFRKE